MDLGEVAERFVAVVLFFYYLEHPHFQNQIGNN